MATPRSIAAKATTSTNAPEGPVPAPSPKADKKASSSSRLTQPTAATVARQKELEVAKAARAKKDAKAKKVAKAVKAAEEAKEARDAKLKAEKDAVKDAKDAKLKVLAEKEARIRSEKKAHSMVLVPKSKITGRTDKAPPRPTTTRASAPPTAATTSLTKPKSSSLVTIVNKKKVDLSITTLTAQCTSILEALDEQVQVNQALVSDVDKLRQENNEFRKESIEIKMRLEKIEGIVINILGGDDPSMELAIDHRDEGGVVEEDFVEGMEAIEGVKMIEDSKEKEKERRRSGRKRKSSAVVEKGEELREMSKKTRRVTYSWEM